MSWNGRVSQEGPFERPLGSHHEPLSSVRPTLHPFERLDPRPGGFRLHSERVVGITLAGLILLGALAGGALLTVLVAGLILS